MQLLFGSPLLAHVNTRANVTGKGPIRIESRHPDVENPSIFTVVPSQTILHPEFLSAVKGLNGRIQESLQILWVNPLRPAVAKLPVNGSAGQDQPRLVDDMTD